MGISRYIVRQVSGRITADTDEGDRHGRIEKREVASMHHPRGRLGEFSHETEGSMNKRKGTGANEAKRTPSRKRQPVTLMFLMDRQASALPIKALIVGGLARLIANRIAAITVVTNKQTASEQAKCAVNKQKVREKIL